MAKKLQRGLGRGLGALLGEDVVAEAAQEAEQARQAQQAKAEEAAKAAEPVDAVRMLPIGLIDPNLEQPRRRFDEAALEMLRDLDVPILLNADLGHLPPAMPFAAGALAQIAAQDGRMTLKTSFT